MAFLFLSQFIRKKKTMNEEADQFPIYARLPWSWKTKGFEHSTSMAILLNLETKYFAF